MNHLNSKTFVVAVVATALLAVTLPAPVAAESGTVSIDGPDSASPGDEVTVSFEITNTGESPSAYILDLSLPADYTITDHTDDDKWNSEDTSWIFQTIEAGDSNTESVAVDVELPADASSSDTITADLKTASGIEDTRSVSLIQSGSDEGTVIIGEVSDVDLNSIENTGDTELTISRTDSSGTSGPVLVNSISLRDFNTLASSNSDVISASFSENGNEPATYSIKLSNAGDLSQYQITADRPGFETFSVTTEPVGVGESTDQNIRFASIENAQITGNVVDDRNNNLPNAEVFLLVRGDTGTFEQLASTTTDSSGSFAFTGADGVETGVDHRLEATFVDEDGTERTGSTTLANVSGGTNTADIVIEGVNEPKESDKVLEDTVSISGSEVTIETSGALAIAVSDLPTDVQITDVSHGSYESDENEVLFLDGFDSLPETVSFTLTPDSDAYNVGDTVEFTVDDSPVSLDVVSQSEVRISSVEFSPETVATDGSTHDLTINVEGLSPDDEADVFTVTIPQDVNVANVNVKNSNVDLVETPTPTNSMTFAVDPTATTTAQIEVELTLEPTSSSPPLPPEPTSDDK